MPRIHVELTEAVYKILDKIPKQVRGKFVNTAIAHFLKTSEGQAIMGFLCSDSSIAIAETSKPTELDIIQYPNLDDWSE